MAQYLIDVNLPYRFSLWKSDDYIHQTDIGDEWTDTQIWNYAKENNLTIITKDADFSNRIIFYAPPPKVIHIRFGNLKMREFFTVMTAIWNEVLELSETHKIVNVSAILLRRLNESKFSNNRQSNQIYFGYLLIARRKIE